MTISLRPITKDNWFKLYHLSASLSAEQQRFIAPNAYSMLEALYEPETYAAYGIYQQETPVGFLMTSNEDERNWVLRLMIGAEHQRKGYGSQAMALILERFKADPNCDEVHICFEIENDVARAMYEQLGFTDTGVIEDGESIYRLPLKESHPS